MSFWLAEHERLLDAVLRLLAVLIGGAICIGVQAWAYRREDRRSLKKKGQRR